MSVQKRSVKIVELFLPTFFFGEWTLNRYEILEKCQNQGKITLEKCQKWLENTLEKCQIGGK